MKNKVVDLLEQNIEGMSHDELSQLVEIPPKTEMGDFAFLLSSRENLPQSPSDDCSGSERKNWDSRLFK